MNIDPAIKRVWEMSFLKKSAICKVYVHLSICGRVICVSSSSSDFSLFTTK